MTVPSFIISTNLPAALETPLDLWEDLLYLSALQQGIKIDTPYNKAVQITVEASSLRLMKADANFQSISMA